MNGGSEIIPNRKEHTYKTDTFRLNNPYKERYAFLGWIEGDNTDPIINTTIQKGTIGNRVYTANWKQVAYTIVYDCNTGYGSMANSYYTYGIYENLSTNQCYKIVTGVDGLVYEFKGWSMEDNTTSPTFTDQQDIINLGNNNAIIRLYAV